MFRVFSVALTTIAVLGTQPALARDPQETTARVRFAAGKFQESLELYANLLAETDDPVYLRNIGRCYQMLKKPDEAIDNFRTYLRRYKKLSDDERDEVEGFIREMESLRATQAAPPPTTSAPPAALPPATRLEAAPAPVPAGIPTMTRAREAEAPTLVSMPATTTRQERHPIYTRWWFWTGVGVLVAGAAVGAALVMSGRSSSDPCFGQSFCVEVKP